MIATPAVTHCRTNQERHSVKLHITIFKYSIQFLEFWVVFGCWPTTKTGHLVIFFSGQFDEKACL